MIRILVFLLALALNPWAYSSGEWTTRDSTEDDVSNILRGWPYYDSKILVGAGSFSNVFKERNPLVVEHQAAIKVALVDWLTGDFYQTIKEALLMRALHHARVPGIADLKSAKFFSRGTHDFGSLTSMRVFEMGMPLYDNAWQGKDRRKFLRLATTISFLHEHDIAHEDIKGPNILWDSELEQFLLADFDSANLWNEHASFREKTSLYSRSPEKLIGLLSFPKEGDIWALGISYLRAFYDEEIFLPDNGTCSSMFHTLRSLFWPHLSGSFEAIEQAKNPNFLDKRIKARSVGNVFPQMDSMEADLLDKMLDPNPLTRIKASDILTHPFLAGGHLTHHKGVSFKSLKRIFSLPSKLRFRENRSTFVARPQTNLPLSLWRFIDNSASKMFEAIQPYDKTFSVGSARRKVALASEMLYPYLLRAKVLEQKENWVLLLFYALILTDQLVDCDEEELENFVLKNQQVEERPSFAALLALYIENKGSSRNLNYLQLEVEFKSRFEDFFAILFKEFAPYERKKL